MPLPKPTSASRASRTLLSRPTTVLVRQPIAPRSFTSSATSQSASGDHGEHESHYDPPAGWLFGVPPGQKAEKEGWETVWYWGFFGSLGLATVAYAFKPDTSIQTWALEEARRRLEAEGILQDPGLKEGRVGANTTE